MLEIDSELDDEVNKTNNSYDAYQPQPINQQKNRNIHRNRAHLRHLLTWYCTIPYWTEDMQPEPMNHDDGKPQRPLHKAGSAAAFSV